jgi:hypothetical protein
MMVKRVCYRHASEVMLFVLKPFTIADRRATAADITSSYIPD